MSGIRKGQITGLMLAFLLTTAVMANPTGGQVAAGAASIGQGPGTTVINQTSQRAVINWQSFNIGSGELTQFVQPNSSSMALNRISPTQGASQIFGTLKANGQVILINPAGIYFAPGSYVNVGGLIATTTNISNENFMAGHFVFNDPTSFRNAAISNAGTIIAAQHGLVALVGPNVTNSGMIQANLGKVALASGDTFTVGFAPDGLVNFAMNGSSATGGGSVTNTGSLIANGGTVLVSAQQASQVLDNVINLGGVVEAKSIYQKNGEVIISGDPSAGVVSIAANIDVSGPGNGGTVNITGHDIWLQASANINASGDLGGGQVNVGGNVHGEGPLPNASELLMSQGASINASANVNGNGGNVVLWSDEHSIVQGFITAIGGSQGGDGGFVETSSHNLLEASNVSVNTSAAHGKTGTWLLDPANVTISAGADSGYTPIAGVVFTPNSGVGAVTVNTTTLANALLLNNINITTGNNGVDGGQPGLITVSSPISWASGNSLTLFTLNNIAINASITIGNSAAAQLILDVAGTATQTAAIGGPGQLVLSGGGGTFIASQANTYTGGTIIRNGTILMTNTNGLGTSGTITIIPVGVGGDSILDMGSLTGMANTSPIIFDSATFGGTAELTATSGGGNLTLSNDIDLSGSSNLFNQQNPASIFLSGVISGTGDLTFQGGTDISNLYLQNNNTYGGTTTVLHGDLILQASGALGTGPVFVTPLAGSLATLEVYLLSSLDNTNTINFDSSALGSTAQLNSANTLLSNDIVLTGTTNRINNIGVTQFAGTITGSGDMNVVGGSMLQLSGSGSTYNGTTTVNNGLLQALATNTFSPNSNIFLANVANASLDLNNFSNSIAALNGGGASGGNITLGTGTLTVNGGGNYSGAISGNGGLTVNGGTLQLNNSGNITYLGTTTINAGTLLAGAANTLSPSSGISLANVAGANINLNNFSFSIPSLNGGGASGGNVSLGSGILTITGGGSYGGAISGSGSLNVNGGTLTLSGTNNQNGTTVSAGTLIAASTGALGSTAFTTTINPGATLNINNVSIDNPLSASGTGVGGLGAITSTLTAVLNSTLALTGDTTIGSTDNGTFNINGTVSGGFALTKVGNSVLHLLGSNSFNALNVNAGAVEANNTNAFGVVGSPIVVASGATLSINGLTAAAYPLTLNGTLQGLNTAAYTGTVNLGSSAFIHVGSSTFTLSGQIGGSSFSKTGGGTLILSNTGNNYTGSTDVTGGILQLGASGVIPDGSDVTLSGGTIFDLNNFAETIASLAGSGDVSLGSATLTITGGGSYSGAISGSGGLDITGGTLTLSGNSNYTGTTTVDAGTLVVASASGLGTTAGGTLVNTGAALTISGVNVGNESVSLSDASLNGTGTAGLAGPVALNGSIDFINALSGTFTLSGALTGNANLILNGPGTVRLTDSGNNTYSGTTNINGGTLQAGAANTLSTTSAIVLANVAGASLDLNNFNFTAPSLNGGAASSVSLGSATLTISGGGSYAGTISGSGGLDITGGTFTLSGNSNYTGTTTVDAGTLIVASANGLGSTAGGTVVNAGTALTISGANVGNESVTLNDATLNGTGTAGLAGPITLGSGTSDVIDANSGTFTLSGAINGSANLTLQGAGNLVLAADIGSGTSLTSLLVNTLLDLGSNVSLSADTITINNGVTGGGNDLSLNGNTISLTGAVALNDINVTGTGVNNSFALDDGNPHIFTVTGPNISTMSTSGIGGSVNLSNVQSFTGGTSANKYMFTGNGSLSGLINGNGGTLDFSGYGASVTDRLTANKFAGTVVSNGNGSTIISYTNIVSLVGTGAGSMLILTPEQLNQAVKTGPLSGYIGDPVFWSGFTVNFPSLLPDVDISSIIQQPSVNNESDNGLNLSSSVGDNLDALTASAYSMFDDLTNVKINPYCYQAVN